MKQQARRKIRLMDPINVLFNDKSSINDENDDYLFQNLEKKMKKLKPEELYRFTHMFPLQESDLSTYLSLDNLRTFPPVKEKFVWFKVPFLKENEIDVFLGLLLSFSNFDQIIAQINQNSGQSTIKKHWIVFYYTSVFLSFLYDEKETPQNLFKHRNRFVILKSTMDCCYVVRADFYWMEFYRMQSYLYLIKNPNNLCLIHPVMSRFFEFSHVPINYHYNIQIGGCKVITYQKEKYKYLSTFKKWFSLYWMSFMLLGWKQKNVSFVYKYKTHISPFLLLLKPFPDWIESKLTNSLQTDDEKFDKIWKQYSIFFHQTLTSLSPNVKTIIDSFYGDEEEQQQHGGETSIINSISVSNTTLQDPTKPKKKKKNPLYSLSSALFLETIHVINRKVFNHFYNKFKVEDLSTLRNDTVNRNIFLNLEDEKYHQDQIHQLKMKNKKALSYKLNYPNFWQTLNNIKKYNDATKNSNSDFLTIDSLNINIKQKTQIKTAMNNIMSQEEYFTEDDLTRDSFMVDSSLSLSSKSQIHSSSSIFSSSSTSSSETDDDRKILFEMKSHRDKDETLTKASEMTLSMLTFGFDSKVSNEEFKKDELQSLHASIYCLTHPIISESANIKSTTIKEVSTNDKKRKRSNNDTSDEEEEEDKDKKQPLKKHKSGKKPQQEIMFELYKNSWNTFIDKLEDTEEDLLPPFLKTFPFQSEFYLHQNDIEKQESEESENWQNHNVYRWGAVLEIFFYMDRNQNISTKDLIKNNLIYMDKISTKNSSVLLNPMEILLNVIDKENFTVSETRKQVNGKRERLKNYNLNRKDAFNDPLWDLESVMIFHFKADDHKKLKYETYINKYYNYL